MKKHLVVSGFFWDDILPSYVRDYILNHCKDPYYPTKQPVLWKVSVFLLLQVSDFSNLLTGNHLVSIFYDCYDLYSSGFG